MARWTGLLLAAALSCLPAPGQSQNEHRSLLLHGVVRDRDGAPAAGAEVRCWWMPVTNWAGARSTEGRPQSRRKGLPAFRPPGRPSTARIVHSASDAGLLDQLGALARRGHAVGRAGSDSRFRIRPVHFSVLAS